MRSLTLIFTCFCTATVISQVVGLGILWYRGQLSPQTLRDLQSALSGEQSEQAEEDVQKDTPEISLEEVLVTRARMSVEYNTKESELAVLKGMMLEGTKQLTAQQAAFEKRKKAFEKELEDARLQVNSEATTQARGILMALPPKDAVEKLMQVSVAEDVVLLKGMPEKSIAKILKEFKNVEQGMERGKEIFEAISSGEPTAPIIDRMKDALNQTDADAAGDN